MTVLAWIVGSILAALLVLAGGVAIFAAWTARRVEKVLPPRGHFIEVDGARIHYLDEGSGPTLVLIHGLGGQMHNFTHSLLDRLKHNHRVIILDRPGSGYSTRARKASAALGAQARTIAGLVERLGLERPLIVGHSLGGAIALMLALEHPEKIGGLALLAPATHAGKAVPPMFRGIYVRSNLMRGSSPGRSPFRCRLPTASLCWTRYSDRAHPRGFRPQRRRAIDAAAAQLRCRVDRSDRSHRRSPAYARALR